jgi:type VI secretion system FHA domain protein
MMPNKGPLGPSISSTIPEDWDLDSLTPDDFTPSAIPPSGDRLIPDDAFDLMPPGSDEQKINHGFAESKPEAPANPLPIEKPTSIPTQEPAPSHATIPQQIPESGATSSTAFSHDDFFDALYAKLGLPKEYMTAVDRMKFADDIVDILMTSTQGIMSLLAGRSVFKQESRLSLTMIKPQSNNPIKFSLDPSDTLEMLLVKKKPGYMTAQDAYSEALNDIQLHQMAFLAGLQATLSGVIGELAPQDIEDEVKEKGKSFIGLKSSGLKWDAFKAKQDALSKKVNENLNEVLSQHFSDAYEAQINRIKNK